MLHAAGSQDELAVPPFQQTLLACFPTVTPAGDLDYLAASTVAQPGCQPCGMKHVTRTPLPLTQSAAYIYCIYLCARSWDLGCR